jgi:hypothetical protein
MADELQQLPVSAHGDTSLELLAGASAAPVSMTNRVTVARFSQPASTQEAECTA